MPSILLLVALLGGCPARAASEAVRATDDPTTFSNTLEVQPELTDLSSGGWSYTQTQRLLVPYGDQEGIYGMSRFEVPFTYEDSPRVQSAGFKDFKLISGAVTRTSFGAAGLGVDLAIPAASDSTFGNGNWGLGPAAFLTIHSVTDYRFGLLLQQYFPLIVQSDRTAQSYLWLQPHVVRYLPRDFFLIFNPIIKFEWSKSNTVVPLNLGFGTKVSDKVTFYVQPEVEVTGSDSGTWSVKAKLSYLKW